MTSEDQFVATLAQRWKMSDADTREALAAMRSATPEIVATLWREIDDDRRFGQPHHGHHDDA